MGSSPLARGTRLAICGLVAGLGLIPARAGNTWVFRRFRAWTWAHPRLCGEHMLRTDGTKDTLGSSPPVRGALSRVHGNDPAAGLIPARAGSTAPPAEERTSRRAHPRPCGEHIFGVIVGFFVWGSSPPVRGAPWLCFQQQQARGLIPARAGSTQDWRRYPSCGRAHPRPCGEHLQR